MATTIVDTSVTLEPFLLEHIPLLDAWLHRQHVARWYPEPSENLRWARKPPAGGSHAIIASQGVPVGYIRWQQVNRETLDSLGLHEIPSNSVDVDLLLGEREDEGRALVHTLWPSLLLAFVPSPLFLSSASRFPSTTSTPSARLRRRASGSHDSTTHRGSDIVILWSLSSTENSRSNSLKPNQSMKPTPSRNNPSVFATTPCRGLSPSR